ncbi:MAG: hypothetical protein GC151_15820 [Betaproteobacteria bacterium]|nr:hypothetical protein [Betaproteobacteria bacterium]
MKRLLGGVTFTAICALMSANVLANDDAEQARHKEEAVSRVAKAHDEVLITGAARLILKQAAIRMANDLLAAWGTEAKLEPNWTDKDPEWRDAEDRLLAAATTKPLATVGTGQWVKTIRTQYIDATFDGEAADTIATHLESKSGKAQLALMDWFMGEMTLFNYTYTGRFKYDLRGAESELKALQKVAQPRIPKKDNELEFSTLNPEAFQFVACSPESRYCPGVKYARMNAIGVQGAILRHIDDVGEEIHTAMKGMRAEIQPMIDAYRARR